MNLPTNWNSVDHESQNVFLHISSLPTFHGNLELSIRRYRVVINSFYKSKYPDRIITREFLISEVYNWVAHSLPGILPIIRQPDKRNEFHDWYMCIENPPVLEKKKVKIFKMVKV